MHRNIYVGILLGDNKAYLGKDVTTTELKKQATGGTSGEVKFTERIREVWFVVFSFAEHPILFSLVFLIVNFENKINIKFKTSFQCFECLQCLNDGMEDFDKTPFKLLFTNSGHLELFSFISI